MTTLKQIRRGQQWKEKDVRMLNNPALVLYVEGDRVHVQRTFRKTSHRIDRFLKAFKLVAEAAGDPS